MTVYHLPPAKGDGPGEELVKVHKRVKVVFGVNLRLIFHLLYRDR